MSSSSSLFLIEQYLTRYGMTTYLILGSIGLLLNITILTRPAHTRNPCSVYILTMSFCAFIGLYTSVIPVIYASNHPNLFIFTPLYCQLQFYFRHAFNQMMRTFFIMACADRYAISSNNLRIRSLSRMQVTFWVIPSVITLWLIVSIFPTILPIYRGNTLCVRSTLLANVIFSVYLLLALGIIPLVGMTTFSVLLYMNLKKIRRRIQPTINMTQLLRKRDRDMIRMLLVEVMCYIITTIPTIVAYTYGTITINLIKSQQRMEIELFIYYLTTTFLLYINNCLSFWIYVCISRSFRLELKNLIIKFYRFITDK